jgi:hypothetical protein
VNRRSVVAEIPRAFLSVMALVAATGSPAHNARLFVAEALAELKGALNEASGEERFFRRSHRALVRATRAVHEM